MSVPLNAEASFSSRPELLDLQDYPPGATSFQGQLCERGHSDVEQDSEQLCGWGPLRPKALQVFNTPRWVLFFLFSAALLQGIIVYGFVGTNVTSIERRFDLSSSQSGLIVSSYDMASCVCLPFVSYFGGIGHKPRWLGLGVGIMGLGSLLFALPHFTTASYQATEPQRSDTCSSNSTNFSEHQVNPGLSHYFYVFVLGQFLHGIGATPLYTLGFTFLEENVQSDDAPVFMGIFYTAAALGPSLGFLLGGFFLNFYTEVTEETELTSDSPLWVGAWWIGFVVGGALVLPVAFVILGFPKKLPDSQDTAASHQQSKDGSHSPTSTLRDMARSLLLLLKNPTFMFLSLASAVMEGLKTVLTTFSPKYFESQFSFTAADAALIFGVIIIPATGAGTVLGSYFIKRFQLQCRGMTRFCIACSLVSLLLSFIFFIHCPTGSMAGVTVPYSADQLDSVFEESRLLSAEQTLNRSVVNVELVAQCNINCSCDSHRFSPVCGADDVTYYSPCFAGCSSISLTASPQLFTGCSCVRSNLSQGHGASAAAGQCTGSCSYTAVFMSIFTIMIFCVLLFTMPAITATLRCVPQRQKSFALGIQWMLVRTLGTIPGPVVLGSLLDQACLLKQSQDHGSCFLYENVQMSRFLFAACAVYQILGLIFFTVALVFCEVPSETATSTTAVLQRGRHRGAPLQFSRGGATEVRHSSSLEGAPQRSATADYDSHKIEQGQYFVTEVKIHRQQQLKNTVSH